MHRIGVVSLGDEGDAPAAVRPVERIGTEIQFRECFLDSGKAIGKRALPQVAVPCL